MLNEMSFSRPHVLYSFICANHFWEMYSSAFNDHVTFLPSVLVSILSQPLSAFPPDPRPSPLWLQLVSEEVHPPSAPPAVSSHPLPDLQASHSQSSSSSLSTEAQRCLSRAHTVRFLIVFCDCCLSHCTNMIPMSNCRISVVLMSDCTTVKTRQKRTYSRKTCPEFYVINPWPAFSRYNGC